MMKLREYSILDSGDAAQVAEYEHHFYHAYNGLAGNNLVRQLWDWDDAGQRLKTKIPYCDQVIYAWRDPRGRLLIAMAVNVNCGRAFQGAVFGFTPQADATGPEQSCEILNVMATANHRASARASYRDFIRDFGYADLKSRGFEIAYSTCTRRRLRPYLRLGATLLAENSIQGEERFFLAWPVRAATSGGPARDEGSSNLIGVGSTIADGVDVI